jgi:hypothetical protein
VTLEYVASILAASVLLFLAGVLVGVELGRG